jgi:arginine decarboxylase
VEVVAVPAGSNAYNSLWQVRTDAWSTLEESTSQLAVAGAQQHPVERLAEPVTQALDVLAPIERFWAFPGMSALYKARRLFATGKYDRCATIVARINRSLATDSYRSSQTWDVDAEDDTFDHEPGQTDLAGARSERPYFEVLVVDVPDQRSVKPIRR